MTRRGHGRAEDMWAPTNMVGRCAVCNGEWQIKDQNLGDSKSCPWCGASSAAISVYSEGANDYGAIIVRPR